MLAPFENGPLLDQAMVAPTVGNFIALQPAIPAASVLNQKFDDSMNRHNQASSPTRFVKLFN